MANRAAHCREIAKVSIPSRRAGVLHCGAHLFKSHTGFAFRTRSCRALTQGACGTVSQSRPSHVSAGRRQGQSRLSRPVSCLSRQAMASAFKSRKDEAAWLRERSSLLSRGHLTESGRSTWPRSTLASDSPARRGGPGGSREPTREKASARSRSGLLAPSSRHQLDW